MEAQRNHTGSWQTTVEPGCECRDSGLRAQRHASAHVRTSVYVWGRRGWGSHSTHFSRQASLLTQASYCVAAMLLSAWGPHVMGFRVAPIGLLCQG